MDQGGSDLSDDLVHPGVQVVSVEPQDRPCVYEVVLPPTVEPPAERGAVRGVEVEFGCDAPSRPSGVQLPTPAGGVQHRMVDDGPRQTCRSHRPREAALRPRAIPDTHPVRHPAQATSCWDARHVSEALHDRRDLLLGHDPLGDGAGGDAFEAARACHPRQVDDRPGGTRAAEAGDLDDVVVPEMDGSSRPWDGAAEVAPDRLDQSRRGQLVARRKE
jgi:hypothetical protein